MSKPLIYQTFDVPIAASGVLYTGSIVKGSDLIFDKRCDKAIAFQIVSDYVAQVYLQDYFKMDINGQELFPINTPAKIFTTNNGVEVDKKWHFFSDIEIIDGKATKKLQPVDLGNQILNLQIQAIANTLQAFAVHNFSVVFMLKQKD